MKKYLLTLGLLKTLTFLGLFIYFYKTSGRSSNDGSGPGKPDDFDSDSGGDSLPKLPQVESIEKTEERVENIERLVCRMEEDSDTLDTESQEDQCDQQNKAGINELPHSSKFIYNLKTKTARKAAKIAWKNSEARKEIISNLDKIDKGNLFPRNEKTLKELKFTKTRMLVRPGKNGKPDEVVAICLRRDLDVVAKKLKNKFD